MVAKNCYTLLETNKKLFVRSANISEYMEYHVWKEDSSCYAMNGRNEYVYCYRLCEEKTVMRNVISFAFWKQAGLHSIYDLHIVNWDPQ